MNRLYCMLAALAVSLTMLSTILFQFPLLVTIFVILFFVLLIMHFHRRHLIKVVNSMTFCEKVETLNNFAEPFGFLYQYPEDIFSSPVDAWQREFGYCRLYDNSAPLFHMIFDSEPVYFNYQNKTWLIEFWKGQYGINTGAEVGVYYADRILSKKKRHKAEFQCVKDNEMLKITYRLLKRKKLIYSICGTHWWLNGFSTGQFSQPQDLRMAICITFPEYKMLDAFVEGMLKSGYDLYDLDICGCSLCFNFTQPKSRQPDLVSAWQISRIQMMNRLFCRLYLFVTRPFDNTLDRLTFLRLNLPFVFKRTISMKKLSKRYKKSRR